MTDARFPERWLNDKRIVRLSDAAFRTFALGLIWAVANRTDGDLEADDLELIHGADPSQGSALVAAGLWEARDGGGWHIGDYLSTQTSRAQLQGLDERRRNDAERSKRYRDRKKEDVEPSSRDESRDDIGQDRTGQDRQAVTPAVENVEVDVEPGWPSITAASSSSTQEGGSMRCPCGTRLSDYYVKVGRKACPGHEGMVGAA